MTKEHIKYRYLTLALGPFPPDKGISTSGLSICSCGQFIKALLGVGEGVAS